MMNLTQSDYEAIMSAVIRLVLLEGRVHELEAQVAALTAEPITLCEDTPATDLDAHPWDTKNGFHRSCSWCGVTHPEDTPR